MRAKLAHLATFALRAEKRGFRPTKMASRARRERVTMENIANLDAQKMANLATFNALPPEVSRTRGRPGIMPAHPMMQQL